MNGNGRLLIRKSGTEPKIRIMGESDNKELILKCIKTIKSSIIEQDPDRKSILNIYTKTPIRKHSLYIKFIKCVYKLILTNSRLNKHSRDYYLK